MQLGLQPVTSDVGRLLLAYSTASELAHFCGLLESTRELILLFVGHKKDLTMQPLRAFVVEDNANIRENLIGALEELTCVKAVGTCASESAAIEWLAANPRAWDVIIIDLFLQQGSGLHLAQLVTRALEHQKIVVFSNFVNPGVRKRCAQLGVDGVFDKSTEIDALVDYCASQCALLEAKRVAEIAPDQP